MLVHFDLGFEIMPGTGAKDLTPEEKPFQTGAAGRHCGRMSHPCHRPAACRAVVCACRIC